MNHDKTEIPGYQPLRATTNERDQVKIIQSDSSDRSNSSEESDPPGRPPRHNYLQTPYNEDHYEEGWSDGFKARGGWHKIAVILGGAMLALAAAIAIYGHK